MGPNPFIGVVYHWIGGLASATNFVPFRGIKRWSWEIYWIIQGIAAWLIAPMTVALLLVPGLFGVLHAAPRTTIVYSFFWGAMWGIGGLTFGLAIRYLGIALGYAIALGFCTAFGTLMPPIFSGQISSILHESSGQVILAGVGVCMLAIAVSGLAGYSKEHEISSEDRAEAGERDFSFGKGLAVAIFAGIMSACFAYGLAAGKPIAEIARVQLIAHHRLDLWQNLPVLIVVLWGGFLTNFLWSLFLIVKNQSFAQFTGSPGINPMGGGRRRRCECTRRHAPPYRSDTGKELHSGGTGGSDLVFPVFLLFHGSDEDGQVRFLQLDAAHGEHHHLCHAVGYGPEGVEGNQPAYERVGRTWIVSAGQLHRGGGLWKLSKGTLIFKHNLRLPPGLPQRVPG